ncbi:monovalent cation/H(+) antiporter subunit G, partial [Staphylococcus aureus]|uniref:monovalent cation/H(+) antiporter subunit G n=1 Tax=Staphylococcus aureus TaxID=1280 RepID=UPI00244D5FAC
FIALIIAIGIVILQYVLLIIHAETKISTLSLLLTLIGVLIFFIFYNIKIYFLDIFSLINI